MKTKLKALVIVLVVGIYVGVIVNELMKIEEQRVVHNISSSMEVPSLLE